MNEGLLLVDKPAGWTSHDVVARGRRLCGTRRVGHAGTLDPMATGLLVLGVGRATKLLTFLVGADKSYTATIRLGQSTLTDDADGEVTAYGDIGHVTAVAVRDAVAALTGRIEQVPSAVSAIKVNGQRSYARVRAGEDVVLPPRPVTVARFDVLDQRVTIPSGGPGPGPAAGQPAGKVLDLDVVVDVSSGTYVRALARDLGAALGVGGHLSALRRVRVGSFGIEAAHPLGDLEIASESGVIPVLPLAQAARLCFAARELTLDEASAVGHGQRIPAVVPRRRAPVAAFGPDGRLVAMLDESGTLARAHVVFPPA